ncbi:hypothetical protein HII36_05620 [Nonomuraea sp. NN258]|uniref:hypothetical protein n=1 Tax=Nonomuraea antri TaxID=2730852 RepID=UPI00156A42B6|nr:hypothetical protein [Nonomuraea antri]NRQ31317.1 hypothetical protein [Nonomuraea antri]
MPSRTYRRRSDNEGCVVGIGVVAVLSIAVAIAASGSDEEEVPEVVADCVIATQQVDGTYQVVDDRFCNGGSHAAYYHWLYGSSTTNRPGYVRGGTRTLPANTNVTSRTGTVIRGGFGSSSKGGVGG